MLMGQGSLPGDARIASVRHNHPPASSSGVSFCSFKIYANDWQFPCPPRCRALAALSKPFCKWAAGKPCSLAGESHRFDHRLVFTSRKTRGLGFARLGAWRNRPDFGCPKPSVPARVRQCYPCHSRLPAQPDFKNAARCFHRLFPAR